MDLKTRQRTGSATNPAPSPEPSPTNPNPAPSPAPTRSRTAPPADRPIPELEAEQRTAMGNADQLIERSRTTPLTPEESQQLATLLDQAEDLGQQIDQARLRERAATQRERMRQPTRSAPPAPALPNVHVSHGAESQAEGLRLWLRSFTDLADNSTESRVRASRAGFQIGSTSVRIPCDFGGTLNTARRRALSTGGTNLGAEVVPESTFSTKLTEYISYFSPFLGQLDSEVTADGVDRDYPRVDDTALISTQITASGGTELNPTIPDKDVATGSVRVKAYDFTSGYHKLTPQVLRDSPITLLDKVARGIGHSHARRLERDTILGNGTTEAQGIVTAATVYGTPIAPDALDQDILEGMYFSVPEAYRPGCIWLVSPTAKAAMRRELKDSTGRSLFGKTIDQGIEVLTLFERPVFTSEWMPAYDFEAKPIVFFNPMFYLLRLVQGQSLDVLKEKFYPLLAYVGGMAFGGAWLGPAAANVCIEIAEDS